jgi:hypothetical protein
MVVRLELCARSWEIPCIALLHDVIAQAALPLPRACPAESVGVGLAHRICAEEQRAFLKNSGGPYISSAGRPDALRTTPKPVR